MRILNLLHRYFSPSGSVAFWHTQLKLLSPFRWDKGCYPIDFTSKINYAGPYDDAGVPLLDYKGNIGIQYNPTAVAQFGIGCLQSSSGNDDFLKKASVSGDWLIDWAERRGDQTGWLPYKFEIREAGLKSPFYSGLAQGMAYSFLIRLAFRTGELKYSDCAAELLKAMIQPVDEGGFLRIFNENVIIEEFILDRPSVILDGWLFSIMALFDESFYNDGPEYDSLRKLSIQSLKNLLPLYELGYWSRTDLYSESPKMPASKFYHKLHVIQLTCLSRHCGDQQLGAVANRWSGYLKNPLYRCRATGLKILLKLLRD